MKIALIGSFQQDNLALQYLASSVEKQGHRAFYVPFDSPSDTGRVVADILRAEPDMVGLGLSFQYAINDYLELAKQLRSQGYLGHITSGGHVATFCFEPILSSTPEIDTIVRFEGEDTLSELLSLLEKDKSPRNIPGLVWREGGRIVAGPSRPLRVDLDRLPVPKRREQPLLIGGIPVAFLITSRGCMGECAYCSIRAFNAGAGGPRYRMRSVESVADEIALLQEQFGVGIIFVQDDLFILPNEKKTVERLARIHAELEKRGAKQAVFWVKGRPETITENVLKTAEQMGVVHLFLGIENVVGRRLRYLGRNHSLPDVQRAIESCRRFKMGPSFNLMLFDPDCTLEEVLANLDFAQHHLDLPWNLCRTEIYPGTRLEEQLRTAGRLVGDYRAYGYQMRDPRAEIVFRIMRLSFMGRLFDVSSLMNKLVSLYFAGQVHRALFMGPGSEAIFCQIESLLIDFHRDLLQEMIRICQFAQNTDPNSGEEIRDWAIESGLEMNRRDHHFLNRYERLLYRITARGTVKYGQL